MSFELTPAQTAAADQVQSGVCVIIEQLDKLVKLVRDDVNDKQKAAIAIAAAIRPALNRHMLPELVIAELLMRRNESINPDA